MPAGWVHATYDLMTFGRTYVDVHREKDAASRELGSDHRKVNHEWYQLHDREWPLENPFPQAMREFFEHLERSVLRADEVEAQQAWVGHDVLDKAWDTFGETERLRVMAHCYWLVNCPEVLKRAYGVDVVNGKIDRVIDGQERWEEEPAVVEEYRDLKKSADEMTADEPPEFHDMYREIARGLDSVSPPA
jgi:hypothetical protein